MESKWAISADCQQSSTPDKRNRGDRATYVFLIEANFHPLHSFLIAMTFSFETSIPVDEDGVFSVSSKPSASSTGIVDCDRKALVRYWRDRY
jgi:hypothetical protein